MSNSPLKTWILVAGTGGQTGLPQETSWSAEAVGRSIARAGFGLVTGGWPGVDYLTASAFASSPEIRDKTLSDHLIQVVARSKGYPDFRGGQAVIVNDGFEEFSESLRYANAVVLIGGRGGTYELATLARHEQRPVFPIAGTGGDAANAHTDLVQNWEVRHPNGITLEQFRNLAAPLNSRNDADRLAAEAVQLVQLCLNKDQLIATSSIFVSYSHDDLVWITVFKEKLKSVLRPEQLVIWDDSQILPGHPFESEIQTAIRKARAALLLLSNSFVASSFIKGREFPEILRLSDEKKLSVLWLKVSECDEPVELKPIQALYDPSTPLDAIRSPASLNVVLADICKRIGSRLSEDLA